MNSNRLALLEREMTRRRAVLSLPHFLDYTDPNYSRQWFHTRIAQACQDLLLGKLPTDNLMVFVPPQHGKSEIVSRKFPAWALGYNPRLKIVGISYAASLVQGFSRAIQRTIDSPEYSDIFPSTALNAKGLSSDAIRTIDFFETIEYSGFYKAVGVGGGLTGTPADLAIIDDPVKDTSEAHSQTVREGIWAWYNEVLLTRLHNQSKVALIMTRWHEDDLAGRLLEREPDKWTVVKIPAIREDLSDPDDPRKIGESLWEERHSVSRLREVEVRSPKTFSALYQQRPTAQEGNIIKRDWFAFVSREHFEMNIKAHSPRSINFFLDTAYTESNANDPTGIIAAIRIGNDLYITAAHKAHLNFPDLIRFIPQWVKANGYGRESMIRIEPKANGLSVVQQLRESTHLNVTTTPTPKESKETRLNVASPMVEGGRVVLVRGAWNEAFIDEICGFPSKPHDEYVDLLCYAIDHYLPTGVKGIDIGRISQALNR